MSVEIVLQYSFGCVVFLRSSGIKMSNVEHGALHDMGNDILSIQFTSTDFFVFHVALCSLETLIIHSKQQPSHRTVFGNPAAKNRLETSKQTTQN